MQRTLTFDLTVLVEADALGALVRTLNSNGVPFKVGQDITIVHITIETGF